MSLPSDEETNALRSVQDMVEDILQTISNEDNARFKGNTERSVSKNGYEPSVVPQVNAANNKERSLVLHKKSDDNKAHPYKQNISGDESRRKRKLDDRKSEDRRSEGRLYFSSSSDESIIIIDSPNTHSIFSSPISSGTGSIFNDKESYSPKGKCQRYKGCDDLLPLCVVRPMIGPQLPHFGTIVCPSSKGSYTIRSMDGIKRLKRLALRNKLEDLIGCKMMLLKSIQLCKKELQNGESKIKEVKSVLERKLLEVKLLCAECLASATKALHLTNRLQLLTPKKTNE